MLCEKGIFVIDFLNAEKVVANLVANEEKEIDGFQFLIKRMVEGGHIYKKITVIDNNEVKNYVEKVQLLWIEDFEKLLYPEFKILYTFGGFDLRDFDPSSSDRLIIIAEKNA